MVYDTLKTVHVGPYVMQTLSTSMAKKTATFHGISMKVLTVRFNKNLLNLVPILEHRWIVVTSHVVQFVCLCKEYLKQCYCCNNIFV
jgi:hypothetical protein